MTLQTVTLRMPAALYERIRSLARNERRSLAQATTAVLADALPVLPNLPEGLERLIEGVTVLGDAELLRLARQRGNAHDMRRFEALMFARDERKLSVAEHRELDALSHKFDRTSLLRAAALAEMQARGQNIAPLIIEVAPAR